MVIAHYRDLTPWTTKTSGNTLTIQWAGGDLPSGSLIFIIGAWDNVGGATPVISSITKQSGETADWNLLGTIVSQTSSANAGVVGGYAAILTTVAWSSPQTVTIGASVSARALCGLVFSGASMTDLTSNDNSIDTGSIVTSTANAGDLVLGFATTEANTAPSGDTDNNYGATWSTQVQAVTTGGGSAGNVGCIMQYKIPTGGPGTQQYDITGWNDGGVGWAVIKPAAGGPQDYPVTGDTNSVSTVSGAITAKHVLAGSAAATSATTGAVTAKHWIRGTAASTSGASGNVTKTPKPVSGTAASTSTASGAVTAKHWVQATAAAVSTTVGVVTAIRPVAGHADSVSTATGAITATHWISGTVPIASTVTGDCTVIGGAEDFPVSGTVPVVSTAAGAIVADHKPSGTVPIVSTAAGQAVRQAPASGVVPVVSAATGAVLSTHRPTGTAAVVSTVTGAITADHEISGTVQVVSTVAGDCTAEAGPQSVSGTVSIGSVVSGTVTANHPLTGSVTSTSTATGAITADLEISGTVVTTSGAAGNAIADHKLSGTVSAISSATGSVGGGGPVSGTVVATSTAAGAVTAQHLISGTVPISSTATGSVTAQHNVTATAAIVSTATGAVTKTLAVSGTVAVVSTSNGNALISNRYVNTCETGIADGNNVTTANSDDGGAGDPLSAVSTTGGTITYSTSNPFIGTRSHKLTVGTSGNCYTRFATGLAGTTMAGRVYFKVEARPTGNTTIIRALNASSAAMFQVRVTSAGIPVFLNGSGTVIATGGTALATDQWYRFELWVTPGTTTSTGRCSADIYTGHDKTGSLLHYDSTAANNGTAQTPRQLELGRASTANGAFVLYVDEYAIDDSIGESYIGPAQLPSLGGTAVATSTVSGRVTCDHRPSGAVASVSTAAGAITADHRPQGTVAVASGAVGSISATRLASGAVGAVSTAQGRVAANLGIAGTVPVVSTAGGQALRVATLSALLIILSTVRGNVNLAGGIYAGPESIIAIRVDGTAAVMAYVDGQVVWVD